MKVAFLPGTFRPDRCGVSHYTQRLMCELAGRGVECLALTSRAAAAYHRRPEVVGVTDGWGVGLLASLPLALRRLDPDILHIQHAAGSYGFRRAVFCLVPALRAFGWRGLVAVTLHEYGWWQWRPRLGAGLWRRLGPWGERRGLWDREDLALLTGASAIIVTNDAAARVLANRLPQLSARVEWVPIGSNIPVLALDVAEARAALRLRLGWPADAAVISYFGFLHPVKGLETLLHAFQELSARRPEARLLLSGGVDSLALHGTEAQCYMGKLRELVRELGLGDVVHVTGYLPDELVSQHLAGADVGVLPFNDGVTAKSGSLLAMWSHGLPVVATRPPLPPRELEQAAWLVPGRDAGAVAAGLARLLDDAPLRRNLAARGREAASAGDWGTIAERHIRIYRRLGKVKGLV